MEIFCRIFTIPEYEFGFWTDFCASVRMVLPSASSWIMTLKFINAQYLRVNASQYIYIYIYIYIPLALQSEKVNPWVGVVLFIHICRSWMHLQIVFVIFVCVCVEYLGLCTHTCIHSKNFFFSLLGSTSLLLGLGLSFSFLIQYSVVRTPRTGDQLVARPLPTHMTTQT
jgi:hypothetical protein